MFFWATYYIWVYIDKKRKEDNIPKPSFKDMNKKLKSKFSLNIGIKKTSIAVPFVSLHFQVFFYITNCLFIDFSNVIQCRSSYFFIFGLSNWQIEYDMNAVVVMVYIKKDSG